MLVFSFLLPLESFANRSKSKEVLQWADTCTWGYEYFKFVLLNNRLCAIIFWGRSICLCVPTVLGRCPTFPATPFAWPGWVPRYLGRLSGPLTPNPWRWWSCSVSSPWPRGRRCTTGTPLTTPTMPSWRNSATSASTGMSIRTSRRRWDDWKSSVGRKNQRRGKERGLSRRNSAVWTVSLTTLEMLGNGWRRLGKWAACGTQETHCEIVDSTLGMHLGLWSFTGFEFLYFKYIVYCSTVIKKVLSAFLETTL